MIKPSLYDWTNKEFNIWRNEINTHQQQMTQQEFMECNFVILLSTGSFSPPHLLHIEMFEIAKKHLESQKSVKVLGCLIVPASDSDVKSKLGNMAVPFVHRKKLLELLSENTPTPHLYSVSQAESHYDYYYSAAVVFYQNALITAFPERSKRIKVMFMCGGDKAFELPYNSRVFSKDGCIVISRSAHPPQTQPWITTLSVPPQSHSYSSTALRHGSYRQLHRFVNTPAADYIRNHRLLDPCLCGGRWKEVPQCTCYPSTPDRTNTKGDTNH